jgi:hypothetical protein
VQQFIFLYCSIQEILHPPPYLTEKIGEEIEKIKRNQLNTGNQSHCKTSPRYWDKTILEHFALSGLCKSKYADQLLPPG